ncbi:MAG: hypothetical protein GYA31_01390 [Parcubacteria group bacterium]|nr:hypothetical protein [Parcubacteria group bacterium]
MLIFIGCVPAKSELEPLLTKQEMMGEHSLAEIETGITTTGFINAKGFFDVVIYGEIKSEKSLLFYWHRTPNEIIATTLPYSKFKFIIDETKNIPTVEFVFDIKNLDEERIFPEIDDLALKLVHGTVNPNEIIMSKYLISAIIRISSTTLEKEIYLPK